MELVLRLFSLYENWENYEKPMLRFLNKNMSENRAFDSDKARKFELKFPQVTAIINSTLSKPFRPKGVISTGVLEATIIALLEGPEISSKELAERYSKLIQDTEFEKYIGGATTDTSILINRIKEAKRILKNA